MHTLDVFFIVSRQSLNSSSSSLVVSNCLLDHENQLSFSRVSCLLIVVNGELAAYRSPLFIKQLSAGFRSQCETLFEKYYRPPAESTSPVDLASDGMRKGILPYILFLIALLCPLHRLAFMNAVLYTNIEPEMIWSYRNQSCRQSCLWSRQGCE